MHDPCHRARNRVEHQTPQRAESIRTAEVREKVPPCSRPSLCSVHDVEDDQAFLENLINDDIRKSRNDEFAGVLQPPVAAPLGHSAQALDRLVDGACNPVCRFEVPVLLNPFRDRFQI